MNAPAPPPTGELPKATLVKVSEIQKGASVDRATAERVVSVIVDAQAIRLGLKAQEGGVMVTKALRASAANVLTNGKEAAQTLADKASTEDSLLGALSRRSHLREGAKIMALQADARAILAPDASKPATVDTDEAKAARVLAGVRADWDARGGQA
jgi:hypothetical protein